MRKQLMGIGMTAIILSSLLTGCNRGTEPTIVNQSVKTVEIAKVEKKQVHRTLQLSGTLESLEETVISFEVGGRIMRLSKETGDLVEAGETLGKIDDSEYRLQLEKAMTAAAQAQASLAKVNNGAREQELTQAQLLVDKAQVQLDKAQEDLKKMEQLYQNGAIPKDTWENAVLRAEIAAKDLESAKTAQSLAQAGARQEDKDQMESLYRQQLVQTEQAQLALQKTTLVSPVSGTVIGKMAEEGQWVGGGTPVYRIGNMAVLKVVLPVPDREVSYWKPGNVVDVELYGQKRRGRIEKIYPTTHSGTGTVGVEVLVDNSDRKWIAGQVVQVTHQVRSGTGLFVPVEAVIRTGEEKPYLYIVHDGKAVKKEVEIGLLIDNQLEIRSGLSEGQAVVSKGADRLFDGDAIEVGNGGEKQ